jgi:hypothetical protein
LLSAMLGLCATVVKGMLLCVLLGSGHFGRRGTILSKNLYDRLCSLKNNSIWEPLNG